MPLVVAIIIIILLSIKFIGFRAFMYANVLLLTCAWGIVTVIAGNQLKGEQATLMFGLLLIGIIVIVLTLVLTSLHVPKEKKISFLQSMDYVCL